MPQFEERYINHTKLLKKAIFLAKSKFSSIELNLSKGRSKSTWKTLTHIVKPNRMFRTIKLETNNTLSTDHKENQSKFNKSFSHVTDKLINNIPPKTISMLANISSVCNTFAYFETNLQEFSKLIKLIKSKKGSLNEIPTFTYKFVSDETSPILSTLYNESDFKMINGV